MSSQNNINQVGNLVADPELRFTTGGRAVCQFRIGVNDRYQVNGEWKERSSFHTVIAWGNLGENIAASLHKGDRVMVSGRLESRDYDDANGNRQFRTEITADEVGPALRWAVIEGEIVRSTSPKTLVAPNGEVVEPEPEF